MQLNACTTIIDEKKFLETHLIRKDEVVFAERLELYYRIKGKN